MKISPILAEAPLFRDISPEELAGLLNCVEARERQYRRGELLLRRGERTDRLGLVLSGAVHVVREDFWGSRTIVGTAGPGEIFAESYALGGQPLGVSVLAAADTAVLFLNAGRAVSGCREVCACHGRLTWNLLALLAEKNLMLTAKMGYMARRTTREKLLSYLSARALLAGGPEFDIPLDRQQLADYLAVDRSAMSAALGRLRDEGVLTFRKNHFHLLRGLEESE